MTPLELLDQVEAAIADPLPRGRRAVVLALTAPVVLGQRGVPLAAGGFGFTRRQCVEMRRVILAAAEADLAASEG